MIGDTINTTIKPYSELIPAVRPVLKRLLNVPDPQQDVEASHDVFSLLCFDDIDLDSSYYADPIDGWDTREEIILAYESMDVINTICVIEIIGRQYLYTNRKKPFKNPDKVFKSWAKELWEYNEKEKCGTIKYICGKVDMRKYLINGMHLLGIALKEEIGNV